MKRLSQPVSPGRTRRHLGRHLPLMKWILTDAADDCLSSRFALLSQRLEHRLRHEFLDAFRTGSESKMSRVSAKLAGLGPGLTPRGDDFLLGSLYAFWVLLPGRRALRISGSVAAAAVPQTTLLSASWLSAAARGEFARPWHRFTAALVRPASRTLERETRQILGLGHSSGRAALEGLLGVASCELRVANGSDG